MNSAAANNKRRSWSPTVWRLSRKTTIYYQSDISHRSNHDKSIILWNDCCCYVVWTFDGLFFFQWMKLIGFLFWFSWKAWHWRWLWADKRQLATKRIIPRAILRAYEAGHDFWCWNWLPSSCTICTSALNIRTCESFIYLFSSMNKQKKRRNVFVFFILHSAIFFFCCYWKTSHNASKSSTTAHNSCVWYLFSRSVFFAHLSISIISQFSSIQWIHWETEGLKYKMKTRIANNKRFANENIAVKIISATCNKISFPAI